MPHQFVEPSGELLQINIKAQRDLPKGLDGNREFIRRVGNERVERIAETRLTYQLERSATHPDEHIELDRSVTPANTISNCLLQLSQPVTSERTEGTMLDGTNLAADSVEDRYDTPHVVRGEDRIQHLALLPVVVA